MTMDQERLLHVDREWYRSDLGCALLLGQDLVDSNHEAEFERQKLATDYGLHQGLTMIHVEGTDILASGAKAKILQCLAVTDPQYLKHRALRKAKSGLSVPSSSQSQSHAQSSHQTSTGTSEPHTHDRSVSGSMGSSNATLSSRSWSNEASFGESRLLPEWRVRLHGKMASGKSSVVTALCGRSFDGGSYEETPGLEVHSIVVPVKLEKEHHIRWACLTLEDAGTRAKDQYQYLQYDPSEHDNPEAPIYDAHIVVFSMSDKESLLSAKKTIHELMESQGTAGRLLVVGTKVDEFQHYQVAEEDIEHLCQSMKVPVCLVNAAGSLTDEHSVYHVVEELYELMCALQDGDSKTRNTV